MLDLLIYRLNTKMAPNDGEHTYMVCGKSCLAGDIFGEYQFDKPLQIGDRLRSSVMRPVTPWSEKLVQRPEDAVHRGETTRRQRRGIRQFEVRRLPV